MIEMEQYCTYCGTMLEMELFLHHDKYICNSCMELKKSIIYTMNSESSDVSQVNDVMDVLHALASYYGTDIDAIMKMFRDSSEHNPLAMHDIIYWMINENE